MRAREVMNSVVTTVETQTSTQSAAALLISRGFAAAPVLDSAGRVVGVVSEADSIRGRVALEGWHVEQLPDRPVAEVMTAIPSCMRLDDDLADVTRAMLDSKVRSMPIVDEGRLVAIVSRRDVLRAVANRELTSREMTQHRVQMASHSRGES